jgi:hypothetical protein
MCARCGAHRDALASGVLPLEVLWGFYASTRCIFNTAGHHSLSIVSHREGVHTGDGRLCKTKFPVTCWSPCRRSIPSFSPTIDPPTCPFPKNIVPFCRDAGYDVREIPVIDESRGVTSAWVKYGLTVTMGEGSHTGLGWASP